MEREYTVPEVAKILGLTSYTVREYLKSGKLEGFKNTNSGRSNNDRWRIKESVLKAYVESRHG